MTSCSPFCPPAGSPHTTSVSGSGNGKICSFLLFSATNDLNLVIHQDFGTGRTPDCVVSALRRLQTRSRRPSHGVADTYITGSETRMQQPTSLAPIATKTPRSQSTGGRYSQEHHTRSQRGSRERNCLLESSCRLRLANLSTLRVPSLAEPYSFGHRHASQLTRDHRPTLCTTKRNSSSRQLQCHRSRCHHWQ